MKNLIKKAYNFYQNPKIKSSVNYIFFGICTTLVNFISYSIFIYRGMDVTIANIVSIILSILFAYFVNARYVFASNAKGFKKIIYELSKFFTARLLTLIIEVAGVDIMIYMSINAYFAKFIIQFVILVANYIISKKFIFKKEK